jgi:hypothetical protein
MGRLFERRAILTVGKGSGEAIRIDNRATNGALDFSFNVTRTLKKDPNKAEIRIFNLNQTTRSRITSLKRIPVELEAGYDDDPTLIFRGNLREARTERNGPDIITIVSGEDGGDKARTARINRSFGRGAAFRDVVEKIAADLGLGLGNISKISADSMRGVSNKFAGGVSFQGNAGEELERILASANLEYSIQDGNLQILELGKPLPGVTKKLTPETGVIGSPTRGTDGLVTVEIMMVEDLFPGRLVPIETQEVEGNFKIETANYIGDTAGPQWGMKIECREVK